MFGQGLGESVYIVGDKVFIEKKVGGGEKVVLDFNLGRFVGKMYPKDWDTFSKEEKQIKILKWFEHFQESFISMNVYGSRGEIRTYF